MLRLGRKRCSRDIEGWDKVVPSTIRKRVARMAAARTCPCLCISAGLSLWSVWQIGECVMGVRGGLWIGLGGEQAV